MTLPADVENKGNAFLKAHYAYLDAKAKYERHKAVFKEAQAVRDKAIKEFTLADGIESDAVSYWDIKGRIIQMDRRGTGPAVTVLNVQR